MISVSLTNVYQFFNSMNFKRKLYAFLVVFFTKYYYHLALKKYILNNISFNNMHIHNFWQYVLWSAFFFLQCHSNYVNYSCSLWEDNIWITDQLVHITILNVSFESLKYIQEYYMISNCLHVIWINYYLDSYVVENLCMENVFWIYILIYNTYITYHSFILAKKYFMSFIHKCIYYFYFFAYYWM